MNIYNSKQMVGLPIESQAKKAIAHVLCYIRDNWEIGYQLGLGTQSFSLLTEAYANITKEDLEAFRKRMAPRSDKRASVEIVSEIRQVLNDYDIGIDRGLRLHTAEEMIEKVKSAITKPAQS